MLKKMKLNKEGEMFNLTKEWVVWIIRAIVFFIIASTIFILVYISINSEYQIGGLKHSLLRQHLIYDKNCLAYENDRVYPGIIDLSKFTQANLERCFESKDHGTQINLKTSSLNTIKLNEKLNKFEFCFDKKNFYCSNTTFYVLVNNNGNVEPGILNINILNQK